MSQKNFLITLLLFFSAGIKAQTPATTPAPTTPAEYFQLARQQSDIRQDGAKPFRLTATITSTDEKKKVRTGQYSELWISKDRWKREITIGDYHEATANLSGVFYQLASSPQMDPTAAAVLDDLSPVLPEEGDTKAINKEWSLQTGKPKGGVELVQIARKTDSRNFAPWVLFFTPQTAYIRACLTTDQTAYYNDLRKSMGHIVPFDVTLKPDDRHSSEIKITGFSEPGTTSDDDFAIPGATKFDSSTDAALTVTPGVLRSLTVKDLVPVYPDGALRDHRSGDVELQVTIGRDGHVRDVKVLKTTHVDFVDSAVTKYRRATYKPFTVNSVPISVTATAIVHYRDSSDDSRSLAHYSTTPLNTTP